MEANAKHSVDRAHNPLIQYLLYSLTPCFLFDCFSLHRFFFYKFNVFPTIHVIHVVPTVG